ncbi:DUF3885 domain-containing protein [Sphingobium yanoikuyae]|uniref:DUF3885 domain-containing protein n=1 Tax=Sphingobium yanoikuyae TaxID=13690 RepID=A0A6M4GBF3_SPHYA|nr:DUF3885 domain-containing protein [Sphingobium yanoikuyae]QJR03633.1 DUF3885 domain-containing protein [Sphingobium yanoikuyae]
MANSGIENIWSRLWAPRLGPDDVRLRFELGGEEFDNISQPVPRFLQALHRSSTIADKLFRQSCVGLVAWNGQEPNALGNAEIENGFEALKYTGFNAAQIDEWSTPLYLDSDSNEVDLWTVRSYEMSDNKTARDTILWHAIASEMPIYPNAPVVTFLIDPVNSIMLHAYDDRGMDVMADDAAKLRDTYSAFDGWLLDYDRERMGILF